MTAVPALKILTSAREPVVKSQAMQRETASKIQKELVEQKGGEEKEQKGDGEEKEKKSGIHKQAARKGHGIQFPVFKDEAYLCCRIARTGWQKEKVINSNFIFAMEYGLMFIVYVLCFTVS